MWILAIVLINAGLVALNHAPGVPLLGEEHGPLEMIQLAMLAAVLWLFATAWREPDTAEQVVGGAMAILTAAALVREVDLRSLGGPAWFHWLTHQSLQEVLLVAMALPSLVLVLRKRRYIPAMFRLAFSRAAWPMWAAGVLVVLSVFFDSRLVRWYGPHLRFYEELLETNGYLFLVLAAWRHLGLTRAATTRSRAAALGDRDRVMA